MHKTTVNYNFVIILLNSRKKKHVVVNMNTVVPYDHLIIATGNQYQLPAPTEADVSRLATSSEVQYYFLQGKTNLVSW